MKPANPNVLSAIANFEAMLAELPTATRERRMEIREQAIACNDLMNYSAEVADMNHEVWGRLEKVLTQTFVATNDVGQAVIDAAIARIRA